MTFIPQYYGTTSDNTFSTSFHQINKTFNNNIENKENKSFNTNIINNNTNSFNMIFNSEDNYNNDVQEGLIIVFDGGDVYGYEKDLQNRI